MRVSAGVWARFRSRRLLRSKHLRTARYVNFGGVNLAAVERNEPPGAILRYDGRLATPSACVHIVRLLWLPRYTWLYCAVCPIFRPTVWTVRDLTDTANWSIDSDGRFPSKRLPEARFRARPPFDFYRLMRNYWESIGF